MCSREIIVIISLDQKSMLFTNSIFSINFVPQAIYPSHIKLSEQERSNVCYLAFPDSNSGCMGDTQYHVRIRQSSKVVQETNALKEYDRKSPSFLQTDRDYYWGYVYFRQVKDKSLPRGYFQKVSIISVSCEPDCLSFNL